MLFLSGNGNFDIHLEDGSAGIDEDFLSVNEAFDLLGCAARVAAT
jgi:hypothetical protein